MYLESLGQGDLLGIENSRAAFKRLDIKGTPVCYSIRTFLVFHLACVDLIPRRFQFELGN
jgi:hypothetical protein